MPSTPHPWLFGLLAMTACAYAGAPESAALDATSVGDVMAPSPDAPVLDAPELLEVTLSQSSSMAIMSATSVGCATAGSSRENSYYRVFRLADHQITSTFTARQISFGVQDAAGAQVVHVKLHTLVGALATDHLTTISTADVSITSAATGQVVSTSLSPAAVPAGSTLVAEILVPDAQGAGTTFLLGANTAAETAPGYIRSPACGSATPASFASIGFPDAHIVLTVTGTR